MPESIDMLKTRLRAAAEPALAFARKPWVSRGVLLLAVLLTIGTYVRNMVYPYEGDAHIYWHAAHQADPYVQGLIGRPEGFLYSPAFLESIWPIAKLDWMTYFDLGPLHLPALSFYPIWVALGTLAFVFLARKWLVLLLFPFVFVTFGIAPLAITRHVLSSINVTVFFGLAIAGGFRWPWAWSLVLLTKVTPGLGLLWFVVRREWANLAWALGATLAIVAVSYVIAPHLWNEWIQVLRNNSTYPEPSFAYHVLPLIPRLIIAAAMVVVAARYDARWVVPIATIVAMPYIWDTSLVILLAAVALARRDAWTETTARRTTEPVPAPAAA